MTRGTAQVVRVRDRSCRDDSHDKDDTQRRERASDGNDDSSGDPLRATGVHANGAMRVVDHVKNACMVDLVGGSVSFCDTRVKLVKG